ncbi:MAG: efflux RND transporter periplasmic adaptor subunit [Negativicutes bacterium]|nr:efflux RND transporter periplasmic adaptor subunit [Negativicutes bacterium]
MRSTSRTKGVMHFILPLLIIAIFAAGCGRTQPPPQATVSVMVGRTETRTMPIQVEAVGNVEAFNSVVILPQVTGRILSLHFQQGQDVKAGDLLITIDPTPFEQKLAQAQAQLSHDSEQATFATASAKRYDELFRRGAVSRQDFEQTNTSSSAQAATVQQSQAAAESARIDLNNCYIRSPIDGRTGAFLANLGALANMNVTQLVVVNQIEPLFVKFTVPEKYLAAITAAQKTSALQVTASIADQGLNVADGVLTFIDNTVDISSGVVQMKAQFPNSTRQLWPGQFVRVVLKLGEQQNAIVVPSEAVMNGQKGTYVFVVKDDMTVEARPVVQDRVIGKVAVITKGLTAGETVVTDGQVNLRPGSAISIKEGIAQPTAAGANTQSNTQGGGGQ